MRRVALLLVVSLAGPLLARPAPLHAQAPHAQAEDLAALAEASRRAPRDAASQRAYGLALLRAGRYREARQSLGRAAQLSRGSLEALYDVARVSFAEGDHRGADAACRAMARVDRAATLTRVCEARTDLTWARSARAFDVLRELLARDPSAFEALLALGDAHRLRASVAEAEAAYQQASAASPARFEPYLGLGRLYAANGRRDDALRALRRAHELDPSDLDVAFELGRLLANDEGLELVRRAASERAAWPEAQVELGDELARRGDRAGAEAAYRAAIAARADHEPAHAGLGRVLLAAGETAQAEASLRRALELVQNDAQAMIALGELLARTDRVEEAYETYRGAFGLDPRNAEPMLRAARLALSEGRDVLASGFLDSILRNQPEQADALALYGDVMRARGDQAGARRYYERALAAGTSERARVEAALRAP